MQRPWDGNVGTNRPISRRLDGCLVFVLVFKALGLTAGWWSEAWMHIFLLEQEPSISNIGDLGSPTLDDSILLQVVTPVLHRK
jgi:hypothetical protein